MTLMSGTMFSQILAFAISPILTRIYTPEDYGILGVYAAMVSMISVVGSLKFEAALLLPKLDSNALKLFKLCYRVLFVITTIVLIFLLLFYEWFLVILNAETLGIYILLSSISLFLLGGFHINNNMLNRYKRYRGLAVSKVSRTSGTSLSQLGFGLGGFSFSGLIFGRLIGEGLGFLVSRYFIERTPRHEDSKSNLDDSSTYKELIRTYDKFPKITAIHALTNTSASSLPTIFLVTFFNSTIAGWFNQCIKVTFLPITLISTSTYQVYSQKVTTLYNNNKGIRRITIETVKKLALLGSLPFLFLLFFAPDAFAFVFSENWRVAGEFAQLMVPYLFMVFVVSPLAYLPILFGQQSKSFKIELIYLVLKLLAIIVGVYFDDAYMAVGLYSFISFCTLTYVFNWYLNLSKIKP